MILSNRGTLYEHVYLNPFLGRLSESHGRMCSGLPAHVTVCDIFLLHWYLPLFVLSGANKMSVLRICLCTQVFRPTLMLFRPHQEYG